VTNKALSPTESVAHLEPAVWAKVNRLLVAKAIGELAHELLIQPRLTRAEDQWGRYVLATDQADVEYHFRAQVLSLDHWHIEKDSIRKLERGQEAPLDAMRLVVELRERLAIPPEVLPEYLQELASTLYAAAYKHRRGGLNSDELTRADFQEVETAMMEGHPIFLANNGRIGFNALDYPRYAPEAAAPVALVWLAVNKSRADFACVNDLSYAELMQQELGGAACDAFARMLVERGLDPNSYLFLPVHPWQWENRLAQLFAPDLASGDLVYLGVGEDLYLAQQSIRTFYNISREGKRYVKTALSILNMGFTRGISASITDSAAAVNDWVSKLVQEDACLQACRFSLLREVAFMGYRHRYYEAAITRRSDPYKEMLAALWRENPTNRLKPGQRLMTMAALMHIDRDGVALLPTLIRSSGASIDVWLRRYLHHYLQPLVHCFYAHNLLFTPHCENTILVLVDNLPVGVIIKDLAEDIGVLNPENELPENVRRLALRVPEEVMTLGIFTDVFDCVFRFLAQILHEHAQYPQECFWRLVAECISQYQHEQPQLAAKFRRYDLFAPTFSRNCLNRLQLRNNRQMVDLNAAEPVDSLQMIGTLQNPIAPFRESESTRSTRKEAYEIA
jgi:siderophore synthetase component